MGALDKSSLPALFGPSPLLPSPPRHPAQAAKKKSLSSFHGIVGMAAPPRTVAGVAIDVLGSATTRYLSLSPCACQVFF